MPKLFAESDAWIPSIIVFLNYLLCDQGESMLGWIQLEQHIMCGCGIEKASWRAYLQSVYYSISRTIGRMHPSTKNGKRESGGLLSRGKESERLEKNFRRINDSQITRKSARRRREEGLLMCQIVDDLTVLCLKSLSGKEEGERAIDKERRGDEGKPLNLISGSLGACFPRVPHFLVSYLIHFKYQQFYIFFVICVELIKVFVSLET